MRDWFWERFVYIAAALGIAVLAAVNNVPPARSASSHGTSNPLSFAKCEMQADRYIVCSVADRRVYDYLGKNATMPAGTAFGQFIAGYFSAKGCAVGSIYDGLRVNGVFFSWDTKVLANVVCAGRTLQVSYFPGRMMIADLVALYLADRPAEIIEK